MRFTRRFSLPLFFAAVLAACMAIIAINDRVVRLAEKNRDRLEQRFAREISLGHNVILPRGLNESRLRWQTAEQLLSPRDIAILGSSHSLRLSAAHLPSASAANFSVSGGTLSCHLITTEILLRREKGPKAWLVVVDPWLFDPQVVFESWWERPADIVALQTRLAQVVSPAPEPAFVPPPARSDTDRFRGRFTLDPLLQAVDGWARYHMETPVAAEGPEVDANVLTAEGAFRPAPAGDRVPAAEVAATALRQFKDNRDRYRYGTFASVDDRHWKTFAAWITLLRRDAEVSLVFSPYHPSIYPRIIEEKNNHLSAIEARTRALAQALGARCLGSYDPSVAGVTADHFVDGDHLNDEGLRALLHTLTMPPTPL